jgi:hypothetical protein
MKICGFNSENKLKVENVFDYKNYSVINISDNNVVLKPNTYNIYNNTYPTTITLEEPVNNGIVNEYVIRFTIPSTVTDYTLSFNCELNWVDNNIPTWEAGCTYEISIIDGYAVFFKYLN